MKMSLMVECGSVRVLDLLKVFGSLSECLCMYKGIKMILENVGIVWKSKVIVVWVVRKKWVGGGNMWGIRKEVWVIYLLL